MDKILRMILALRYKDKLEALELRLIHGGTLKEFRDVTMFNPLVKAVSEVLRENDRFLIGVVLVNGSQIPWYLKDYKE